MNDERGEQKEERKKKEKKYGRKEVNFNRYFGRFPRQQHPYLVFMCNRVHIL
jgi:hypothetical protein